MKFAVGFVSKAEVVKRGGEVVVAIVRVAIGDDAFICSMSSVYCADRRGKTCCRLDVLKLLQHSGIVVMRGSGPSWPREGLEVPFQPSRLSVVLLRGRSSQSRVRSRGGIGNRKDH